MKVQYKKQGSIYNSFIVEEKRMAEDDFYYDLYSVVFSHPLP